MKSLIIGISGSFSGIESLIEEIEDLGHKVYLLDQLPANVTIDVCCHLEGGSADILASTKNISTPLQVCLQKNQDKIVVLLLKNKSSAYRLAVANNESEQSLIDAWIDSIIIISQERISSCRLVELTENQEKSLSESDYQKIVIDWNKTDAPYPQDKTIHQLFEEQVEKTPDSIAVVFEEKKLTYLELNNRANQLARAIRHQYQQKYGISLKPDILITLYFDRSLEMIIAILAVLKAGGAYVPIAPEHPAVRTQFILRDTQAPLLLTQQYYLSQLDSWTQCLEKKPITIVADNCLLMKKLSTENLTSISVSTHWAYVIYTSGTTGQPKGVIVTHTSVVNRLIWQKEQYCFDNSDRVVQKTPFIFDVSVWELLLPIISGSILVFAKLNDHRDFECLYKLLTVQKITKLHFVPSVLSSFFEYLRNKNLTLNFIKEIFCSGEVLHRQLVSNFKKSFPDIRLNNLYGPTEATVEVSFYNDIQDDVSPILIGRPIQNIKFYVLDQQSNPVAIGNAGELHISGIGLARGYLNQPELTAEQFVDNRFATAEDKIKGYTHLYKTGDIVRWLPSGNLEYLGRNDSQVKLRGFRIELDEIDSVITQLPTVSDAATLLYEDGAKQYLVACVVPTERAIADVLPIQSCEQMVQIDHEQMELWPIVSDYGVYDKLIYHMLSTDKQRTNVQKDVFARFIPGKVVLDVGTGSDAYLALLAAECGAKYVYAVEILPEAAEQAKQVVSASPYADVIEVIHGDIATLTVPELVDVCVSQLVGTIGSSEGCIDILRPVRERWLKPGELMLPGGFVTHIAIAQLPDRLIKQAAITPTFTHYAQAIFGQMGGPFDLRVGLTNFDHECLLSSSGVVESVGFNESSYPSNDRETQTLLTVKRSGQFNAFIFWVDILLDAEHKLSSLNDEFVAVPVMFPLDEPIDVSTGETLNVHFNAVAGPTDHLDYHISAVLNQANDTHTIYCDSPHYRPPSGCTVFYRQLHYNLQKNQAIDEQALRDNLAEKLPDYMIPTRVLFLDKMPLTLNGKRDQSALRHFVETHVKQQPVVHQVQDAIEQTVHDAWCKIFELEQIDTEQNFFAIGGDSLKATLLLFELNRLCVNMDRQPLVLKELYQSPSIASQARIINEREREVAINHEETDHNKYFVSGLSETLRQRLLSQLAIEATYLATPLQQGFITESLRYPQQTINVAQFVYQYNQSVDLHCFQRAWMYMFKLLPALRLCFNWDEQPLQLITTYTDQLADKTFDYHDASNCTKDKLLSVLDTLKQQAWEKNFDLTQPGLIHVQLIKCTENYYHVIRTVHHTIWDGWSEEVFQQRFEQAYQAYVNGEAPNLECDDAYLRAQQQTPARIEASRAFWSAIDGLDHQANSIDYLLTKSLFMSPDMKLARTEQTRVLAGHDYRQLRQFCHCHNITLNTVLQLSWHRLIQLYSGNTTTIVGTTVSGRDLPIMGIESSVGLYINSLPLSIDWDNDNTVLEQLEQVQQKLAELRQYAYISLTSLQQESQPLFHSLIDFHNQWVKVASQGSLRAQSICSRYITSIPLTISGDETGKELSICLSAKASCLTASAAEGLLNRLMYLMREVVNKASESFWQWQALDETERHTLLHTWNQTDVPYPQDETIHQLFEQQVEKTPDAVSLVFENGTLTYSELNQRANQLARTIRSQYRQCAGKTLTADTLIALYFDHSPAMVIAILAVLKAGGAYVPIAPEYPQVRTQWILEDTRAPLLLTQVYYLSKLADWLDPLDNVPVLLAVENHQTEELSSDNLPSISNSANLAYVIYTSGTTGQPKGVMIDAGVFAHCIQVISNDLSKKPISTLSLTKYTFDIFGLEYAMPLITGGQLVLSSIESAHNDLAKHQHEINCIQQTPSMWQAFLSKKCATVDTSHIQAISGGESGWAAIYEQLIDIFSDVRQTYGPTEACIWSSRIRYRRGKERVIGKAYPNEKLYVLDNTLNLIPIGAPGELYIGGAGLARGYLNQPKLTAERFINNPFVTKEDKQKGCSRLYKTGDIVRWLPDGNLEYIGRNDQQVKIRGFRIELSEIENVLAKFSAVKQAVVIDRQHADQPYLAAYIVPHDGKSMDAEVLRQALVDQLPSYMVPTTFTILDAIPLTINGKLDRTALPEHEWTDKGNHIAPCNALEEQLCAIWQDVLELEQVGTHDHFFRIGGHSIQAIKVAHRISATLNRELTVAELFQHPTVVALAEHIVGLGQAITIPTTEGNTAPLSFAQERLWFIERYEQGTHAYHSPILLKLAPDVDLGAFKSSVGALVDKHQNLRTIFCQDDQGNDYQQVLAEPLVVQLQTIASDAFHQAVAAEIKRHFDLSKEYPFRVRLYIFGTQRYALLLFHHVAFDGWSMNVLLQDISDFYDHFSAGKPLSRPKLPIQYKDFAVWHRNYFTGERLAAEQQYWQTKLINYEPLQMPADYSRPGTVQYQGKRYIFTIGEETSIQLRALVRARGISLHMLLLTGFYLLLHHYSGQTDITVGTVVANRQYASLQDLIGFFVNSLAIRITLQPDDQIDDVLDRVITTSIEAQQYQDLPFEQLVTLLDKDPRS